MRIKQVRFILGFLVLLLSFQNCGGAGGNPAANSKDTSSTASATQGSKSPTSNPSGASGLNSGSARGISKSPSSGSSSFGGVSAGSAGSVSGGSGSSGGTGGSGSGGSTCLGCGSSGGGTGGSTGSGGIGSGVVTYKITKQPISKSIDEGTEFFVGISVIGGKAPYTYVWYRNDDVVPPRYGNIQFETHSDLLDRIYKEGDYHVVVTDSAGAKLTSSKATIRMNPKLCRAGNYFIDLSVRTNISDGYAYFNDLFYHKNSKYFVSQYNQTITQMRLSNILQYIGTIGFGYFTIGQDISNNQNFNIACSTDVPTVHTSECATNALGKCYSYGDDGYNAYKTYQGSINFTCRSGYIEFVSNTCQLVTPPPPPETGG